MPSLLDALSYVGSSLDKPGAAVRGLLAGKPEQLMTLVPFSDTAGLTDESSRVSGRDLLEYWGLLGPNQEGLDFGDVAGFGAELATDPLNFVGGALAGRAAKVARTANAARGEALASNALREAILKAGGMPDDVARLTKAVDEAGSPLRTYHGTPNVFDKFDAGKMDADALFGPGIYTTADPGLASSYAKPKSFTEAGNPNVRSQFLDVRNPLDLSQPAPPWAFERPVGQYVQLGAKIDTPRGQKLLDEIKYLEDDLNEIRSLRDAMKVGPLPDSYEFVPTLYSNHPRTPGGYPFMEDVARQRMGAMQRSLREAPILRERVDPFESLRSGVANAEWLGEGPPDIGALVREAGYDSIRYPGGKITGGSPHDVWVALDPSQVYAPWVAPAERPVPEARRLSPLLPALLGGYQAGVTPGRL